MTTGKKIALARAISDFGDMFRIVAFPLIVIGIRDNPMDLALAETFGTTGMFLGSLVTPFFIDRFSKIKSMFLADFLSLIGSAILITGSFYANLPLLFSGYFLLRAVHSYHLSALDAITADYLQEEKRPIISIFSRLHLILSFAAVIGGLTASQAIKSFNFSYLLIVDAVSFVVSSALVLLVLKNMKNSMKQRAAKIKMTLMEHIKETTNEWLSGLKLAFSHRDTVCHILSQSIVGMAFGVSLSSVRAHLIGTLKVPAPTYAYLAPSLRAFFLAGAFTNYKVSRFFSPKKLALTAFLLMFFGYLGMCFFSTFWIFICFFGVQQIGNSVLVPMNRAAVMGGLTEETRGRVAAFRGLAIDAFTIFGNLIAVALMAYGTTATLYALPIITVFAYSVLFFVKDWDFLATK